MPDLTAQASRFRAGQYFYTGHLSIVPQTVVLRGTITAVPTYPALTLAYTLNSGSESNVQPDMTVVFFSSTGVERAVLRVASGGTITSTSLPIAEFARGVYDVTVGDTFEVRKEWRIWDHLVGATSTFPKDSRIAYSDQGSNPPPVANGGGPYAGFIDPVTNVMVVPIFPGGLSFTVDPDSSGSKTYAWDFVDGTPPTSTDENPTNIAFPSGFRWVKLTVTDASNSKSSVKQIPVWAHDRAANYPLAVLMEQADGDIENGWNASFRLPKAGEADITTLPDGALVVYWEDEYYASGKGSFGGAVTGRSHIKFVGYLVADTIRIDGASDEVTFEAVGPLAILEQTPALPQLLQSKSSPTKWEHIKSLTINRLLWYIWFWHASVATVFDFLWLDGTDLAYSILKLDSIDNLAEQLRDIANSLCVYLTCDRLGRLRFKRDPNHQSSTARAALTKAYDLDRSDFLQAEIRRAHRGNVKFVRGEGFTAAATASGQKGVSSNAPGNAPAPFGPGQETLAKQIVASGTELNERTGMRFARLNGLYNGQFVPQGVPLKLPDGYDVFDPALLDFVTFNPGANKRGVTYEATRRWIPESVSILYDPDQGLKDNTLTISHETIGPPGITYVPPASNALVGNPITPLDFQFSFETFAPTVGQPQLRPGLQTLAAIGSDGYIYITTDYETPAASGGPSWIRFPITVVGNIIHFVVDAFSPLYLGTGTTVNGWIITDQRIYRIDDIFGARTLTSQFTFATTSSLRSGDFSWAKQGHGAVISYYNGGGYTGVYATYTLDGVNWASEVLVGASVAASVAVSPGCWVSSKRATLGHVYTTAFRASGLVNLYKSTDGGATWTQSTNLSGLHSNDRLAGDLHFPHMGNDDNSLFYFGFSNNDSGGHRIGRSAAGTPVQIGIDLGGGVRHSIVRPNAIHSFPKEDSANNKNYMVAAGPDIGFINYGVWTSQTGGGTAEAGDWLNSWPSTSTGDSNGSYTQVRISGSDRNVIYYWGANKIGISLDFGVTIDDRSTQIRSNWGPVPGSLNVHFVGICGG